MNRRDFLKGAGAAAIVPAAIPAAIWGSNSPATSDAPTPSPSENAPPITAVVYDERYADCKLFAEALIRQGAVAFPANADSAQLWYGSLRAHLARYPGRVAGLTTYADFSVSQACGRELNLAELFEGSHDARRSRTNLTHRLRIPGDAREIAGAFAAAGASWAASLADALSRVPPVSSRVTLVESEAADRIASMRIATATTPRSAGHPGYLASWLLAPLAAVL